MTHEELKYKETKLRDCFKKHLEDLDVDGRNDYASVKCVKTYGVLWHLVHQLLMAEEKDAAVQRSDQKRGYTTSADTMNVQATGLRMAGGNN